MKNNEGFFHGALNFFGISTVRPRQDLITYLLHSQLFLRFSVWRIQQRLKLVDGGKNEGRMLKAKG
jgi:hypothetical protein